MMGMAASTATMKMNAKDMCVWWWGWGTQGQGHRPRADPEEKDGARVHISLAGERLWGSVPAQMSCWLAPPSGQDLPLDIPAATTVPVYVTIA